MPIITVTHTVRTVYEVPEGWTLDQLRHQVYGNTASIDVAADNLRAQHEEALETAYGGKKVDEVGQSSNLLVSEGYGS